jgi:hypothetical protein
VFVIRCGTRPVAAYGTMWHVPAPFWVEVGCIKGTALSIDEDQVFHGVDAIVGELINSVF